VNARPAFYALAPGGWRDYATLLHPPYTLWHLSYVVIGGTLAPRTDWRVVGAALIAFALALGIGAHALDELRGRPLGTRIPDHVLVALAVITVAGASAIGIAVAIERTLWLLVFVAVGTFLVVAYNLELFGGRFHNDVWFGIAWGAFPLLATSFAVSEEVRLDAIVAALFATLLSLAQRTLSTRVRTVRRQAREVSGKIVYRDGTTSPIDTQTLTVAPDRALMLLSGATITLAVALVLHSVM
jgi:hypothetical protein